MNIFKLLNIASLKINVVLLIMLLLLPLAAYANERLFPTYPIIQNNIKFWQDVYTHYSSTQGILHDDEDLSIIYDIIELEAENVEGYQKINQNRIKARKKKYLNILKKLTSNPDTDDPKARLIAEKFGPSANSVTYQKATNRVRCQIGQKDRFLKGLQRSGAYLSQIRDIFETHGLPLDLAYLPHVESSFDLKAYSKFGAAGIWQFTLGTGRRFLKIGYTLDERWDPIISSHAAALLLKENYEKLNSWPLAITAYNHGAAGMVRAKKKWKNYPQIFSNYSSRSFKFASRNFYAEFLAARNVARSYKQYFGEVQFSPPRQTHTIVLEGFANLMDVLSIFKVDIETLAELNPAIRDPVFSGQKYLPQGYRLHLPTVGGGEENELLTSFPRENYFETQKPSQFYAVQQGDTAGKIARMHNIKLLDLLLANNLDRRATIYVNQNLRIPLPGEHLQKVPLAASQPAPAPLDVPKVPQPMPAAIVPLVFAETETPIRTSHIPPAARALPTVKTSLNSEIISGNLKIDEVWTEKNNVFGLIKVEVEETLGHFADWLEVKTRLLRRLNGLSFGRVVHIGQALIVPLDRVSKERFEEKRFDYHKRMQEDFFNAYRIESIKPYIIQPGENIWTLSNEKFNLPLWLIRQCNPAIDLHSLRRAQKLMIPIVEKRS